MNTDETREHFLRVRDHMKQAENIFTETGGYNGDIWLKMQQIIDYLNLQIGRVTFK